MPTQICLSEFLEITDRVMDSKNKTRNFNSGTTRATASGVVLCQFSGMPDCATAASGIKFWGSGDHTARLPA
jgi:hypothetical protein